MTLQSPITQESSFNFEENKIEEIYQSPVDFNVIAHSKAPNSSVDFLSIKQV